MPSSHSNPLTFQELILRLQTFWAERGCVLQQPYDVEVGAGTMAPETFLRVLGPKPYKVAYVQPSRRPADGRYGENPNRLFKHMQLQVILKPPPENVQELYLESLRAIGTLGGLQSIPNGVNARDVIVGIAQDQETFWHPFVLDMGTAGSGMANLNTMLDESGAGWTLINPLAINDAGQIVATGVITGDNVVRSAILTPAN